LSKSDLKLVFNVNIVYGNFKSENSQDYAPKPLRNCTFVNSASELLPTKQRKRRHQGRTSAGKQGCGSLAFWSNQGDLNSDPIF
jgi:hypothetical protein